MLGLTDPCPTSEKVGDALLLDVFEYCVILGLGLQSIANALEPKARSDSPNQRWRASRLHTLVFGWPSGFTLENHDELSLVALECLRATEPPGPKNVNCAIYR
jgi:hypothetical protein